MADAEQREVDRSSGRIEGPEIGSVRFHRVVSRGRIAQGIPALRGTRVEVVAIARHLIAHARGTERSILSQRVLRQPGRERRVRPHGAGSADGDDLIASATGGAHRSRRRRGGTTAVPGNPHCNAQHIPTNSKKVVTTSSITPCLSWLRKSRLRKSRSRKSPRRGQHAVQVIPRLDRANEERTDLR